MSFDNPQFIWIVWTVSNLIGLIFLVVAYKWHKVAKVMFALLFGWASWFNYTTCHREPEVYLNYAERAVGFYANFITGWFSENIILFVSLIAFGQALIAIGMLLKGIWLRMACIGVIIFLMAIAPLGINAGFPFSITVSVAAYLVFRKVSVSEQ